MTNVTTMNSAKNSNLKIFKVPHRFLPLNILHFFKTPKIVVQKYGLVLPKTLSITGEKALN